MSDTEVNAVERHAAALAKDLAYWKNLLTTRTNTLRARAEKAEQDRDALRSILAELADEAVIVPRYASLRQVHTLMARSLDGDRLPVVDLTAAQVEALGHLLEGADRV